MADRPGRSLKLRTVTERRHNGGLVVKVYELGSSGTFTYSLDQGSTGGLVMFASAIEAQDAADDRLRADGHECASLGCREWKAPAAGRAK
ncbi:MAG: hypothetical protein V7647_2191 [Acidobacteriota bacterium]|jgi:uncharacterized membrane protein YhfC